MKITHFLLLFLYVYNLFHNAESRVLPNDEDSLNKKTEFNNRLSLRSRGNSRILGGSEIKPHSQPWLALLCESKEDCGYSCGGSLISPKLVLTAAHCDENGTGDPRTFRYVLLGAHSRTKYTGTEKFIAIEKWIVNPNATEVYGNNPYGEWKSTVLYWDYSLLVLNEKVEMNKYIQAIQLPTRKDQDYTKKLAYTSGWGDTAVFPYSVTRNPSDVPKKIAVEIVPHDAKLCREEGFGIDCDNCEHESIICTYGVKHFNSSFVESACPGDSGGPLFLQDGSHKPTLIGAVSFGKPCGYVNSAVMYAKIDHVLDWITETMEKYP